MPRRPDIDCGWCTHYHQPSLESGMVYVVLCQCHKPYTIFSSITEQKKQEQLIQTISGSFVSISKQYIHTVWENPTENDPKIGDAFGSFNKGAWMGSTSIFESLLFYGASIQYIYITITYIIHIYIYMYIYICMHVYV